MRRMDAKEEVEKVEKLEKDAAEKEVNEEDLQKFDDELAAIRRRAIAKDIRRNNDALKEEFMTMIDRVGFGAVWIFFGILFPQLPSCGEIRL